MNQGVLDKALKVAADEGLLPAWASGELHFANTRVGLRCVELPEILEWAQLAELTTTPNPTYRFIEVQVNERTASRLLRWLEVSDAQAHSIGERLRSSIDREIDAPMAELFEVPA